MKRTKKKTQKAKYTRRLAAFLKCFAFHVYRETTLRYVTLQPNEKIITTPPRSDDFQNTIRDVGLFSAAFVQLRPALM